MSFIRIIMSVVIFIMCFMLVACMSTSGVKYAGVRSSSYGVRPFPGPEIWQSSIDKVKNNFSGSTPTALWIISTVKDDPNITLMEFPADGVELEHAVFSETDQHEAHLDYFDRMGIKVFLQVESASADVEALIDIVLNRYKHHKSVIGFGVDVEWYRVAEREGWGMQVTDEAARKWEEKVKAHNSDYRLFLKHWDRRWMPQNYRGDIIFINDSQGLSGLPAMCNEFSKEWSKHYYPNTVGFQVGYGADQYWWSDFDNPVKTIGDALDERVKQDCGIFWVDFTMSEVLIGDWAKNKEIRNISNEGNLAMNKMAFSSSDEYDEVGPENAIDGELSTRWASSDNDPSWLYIDFEKEEDISKVILIWETSFSQEYKLEVSNDAEEWEEVFYQKQSFGGVEEIQLQTRGRYLRFHGIKRANPVPGWGHSLWEIKFF